MVNHTSCLNTHDQQITQLQQDVAEIKATLKVLEADHLESIEFRKAVLSWMSSQEHRHDTRSLGLGLSNEGFSGSGTGSGPVAPLVGLPKAVNKVQLAEFTGFNPQERIQQANLNFDNNTLEKKKRELVAKVSCSRSAENSNSLANLMPVRVDGAMLDDTHKKLDSGTMVGHGVTLTLALELDCLDLDSLKCSLHNFHVGKVLNLVFTPFDRGKATLYHRPLNIPCLRFSVTWHLWVMHGQPRPPEDESRFWVPVLIKVLGTRLFRRGEY